MSRRGLASGTIGAVSTHLKQGAVSTSHNVLAVELLARSFVRAPIEFSASKERAIKLGRYLTVELRASLEAVAVVQ